jgi:hypothetical protein
MSCAVLKCTFIQIFIHFPGLCPQFNRELRRSERVGKVAIIKQQIEIACAFLKLYLKNT